MIFESEMENGTISPQIKISTEIKQEMEDYPEVTQEESDDPVKIQLKTENETMSPRIKIPTEIKQEIEDYPEVAQVETDDPAKILLNTEPSECISFSYETVVKEELIIEDDSETPISDDPAVPEASKCDKRRKFNSFHCVECDKSFDIAESFYSHINRHKSIKERKYVCEYCQEPFISGYVLKQHERNFHGMHLNNEETPSKQKSVEKTVIKVLTRDESGFFKCPECDKRFQRRAQFTRHLNTHVAKKQARFECDLCGRCFGSRADLGNHQSTHNMKDAAMLKYTTESQGPPVDVREENGMFKCSECDKMFQERFECVRHIWRHKLQKPKLFPCGTCEKEFNKKSNLVRHEALHKTRQLTPAKYRCEKCLKIKCNLIRHYRLIHHKEEAKAMGITLAEFLALRDKAKTELQNPGKPPKYHCKKCDKPFRRNNNLTRHYRLVHDKQEAKARGLTLEEYLASKESN